MFASNNLRDFPSLMSGENTYENPTADKKLFELKFDTNGDIFKTEKKSKQLSRHFIAMR